MRTKNIFSMIALLGIFAGAILTAVSWLHLCSESCNDAHNYRLFGLPFEWIGAGFFLTLGILHFMHRSLAGMVVAVGLGAEIFFILLQKMQMGVWCPVCLSIAFVMGIIGICYLLTEKYEGFMNKWLLTASLVFGFTVSFLGVTKIDQLQAVEDVIKEQIKFGNIGSPLQIYVFTDWSCPACRIVEPKIEAISQKILNDAEITFVDTVVHTATLNYAPYNISFMVNNKSNYFRIRDALGKLSLTTKKPSEQEVQNAVAPLGVQYRELPYEDVSLAMKYFEELADKFKITGTPSVAIVNTGAKKGKKLAGAQEITEANILKAMRELK